jgi:hypothetical protein
MGSPRWRTLFDTSISKDYSPKFRAPAWNFATFAAYYAGSEPFELSSLTRILESRACRRLVEFYAVVSALSKAA